MRFHLSPMPPPPPGLSGWAERGARRTVFPAVMRLVVVVLLLAAGPVRAEDDMRAVGALWTDFTSALRRGDYGQAHRLFSAESRQALSYRDFVSEYGPLSAAREMVLAKPESMATRVDGDWAEITYSGVNPGTGRRFQVGVALTRNQGAWGLVAARNEGRERVEAAARGVLRDAGAIRKLDNAPARLAGMLAALPPDNPVPKMYRFEIDLTRVRAVPLAEGLRPFHLDEWGVARPGLAPSASPPAPEESAEPAPGYAAVPPEGPASAPMPRAPIPEPGVKLPPVRPESLPPSPPPLANGMPEVAEPTFPGLLRPPEMAEPDAPPLSAPPAAPGPGAAELTPERFSLPDSIE